MGKVLFLNVDFSLFRPLEFFVDPKNGDGRNNNPPAMRVRIEGYTVITKTLQTSYNIGVQANCKAKGEKYGSKST